MSRRAITKDTANTKRVSPGVCLDVQLPVVGEDDRLIVDESPQ